MPGFSAPIRVVLADDHEMVREALARILEDCGRIQVVALAADAAQALDAVRELRPEIVVLDYSMPVEGAPDIIRKLLREVPGVKILVLTVHENVHYAVRVLKAGAHGYIIKAAAVDELVEGIDAVHQGQIYVSPSISQEVLQQLARPSRDRAGIDLLSQREFDLLRMLGEGKSLQQCARQMDVTTSTASTYRARIMEKLNLSTTAELIRFAIENNLDG